MNEHLQSVLLGIDTTAAAWHEGHVLPSAAACSASASTMACSRSRVVAFGQCDRPAVSDGDEDQIQRRPPGLMPGIGDDDRCGETATPMAR